METYDTRWAFIQPYVEGKKVLEIGPAELIGTTNQEKENRWLHKQISLVADKLIGLEISPEQVAALTQMGYDIRQGNAENFELGEKFDVIVAGELIEHLSNPGNFLECAKRHLNPGGTLVLTTPNRFDYTGFVKILRTGKTPAYTKPIAKHVMYFDENALSDLLIRHHFSPIQTAYYLTVGRPIRRFRAKLIKNILRKYRPNLLAGLMIVAQVDDIEI